VQTVRENITRHTEASLKIAEAAYAIKGVAYNQQGPAIADNIHASGDGAGFVFHFFTRWHGLSERSGK
jgi:hypothetical protein